MTRLAPTPTIAGTGSSNRRNCNAARTLAEFADDTTADLARLTDELLAVVEETMQPAVLDLWLVRHEC